MVDHDDGDDGCWCIDDDDDDVVRKFLYLFYSLFCFVIFFLSSYN